MDKSKIGKRFQGKVAIITASTQGIGFAIAQRLGLEGASVVISSCKQKNVDEAAEKLRDQGIEVLALACHVSNEQQRKNLIDKIVQKYGKIDVIVSNAATNPSVDNLLQTSESILDKLWVINVIASIILLKDAVPYLQKGSSVVLISSIAGYNPPAAMAMYGVTKTALFGLTKVGVAYLLAMEHANNLSISPIENIDYDRVEGSFNSLGIIGELQSAKRLQEFFFIEPEVYEAHKVTTVERKRSLGIGRSRRFWKVHHSF